MKRSMKQLACAAALATAGLWLGLSPAEAATINVSADITASTTWTTGNTYVLQQVIYVKDGATLTIQPGVIVRGEPESTPGANDPGTLVITRGSKIQALGTKANPIIFTDLNDSNVPGSVAAAPYNAYNNLTAQWGGLILLGKTYVANNSAGAAVSAREVQIEGLTAAGGLGLYGGFGNDDDDSGTLRYVSLRYGGFNLSANNEINGLTLGAVGRNTDISHVEVFNNKDDGVEFFGGTVNTKYIVVFAPGDDSFDWDEGFRGKGQFWFAVKGLPGSDRSDKSGEWDGGNSPDGSLPFAIPTVYNATFVGHGNAKAWDAANKAKDTGLHIRDNSGGRVYNSVFADFGGTTLMIEGGSTTGTDALTSGERSITEYVVDAFQTGPSSDYQLELQDNCFFNFGSGTTIPTTGAAAVAAGGDNKFHHDNGLFTNAALDNDYSAVAHPFKALVRTDITLDPAQPDPVTQIDPRLDDASAANSSDRMAPADGFFTPVSYKGAFSKQQNWACEWTNMSRLGMFSGCDSQPADPSDTDITLLSAVTFSTEDGVTYVILASSDNVSFEPIGTVLGDGTVQTFVDERGLPSKQFYSVEVL